MQSGQFVQILVNVSVWRVVLGDENYLILKFMIWSVIRILLMILFGFRSNCYMMVMMIVVKSQGRIQRMCRMFLMKGLICWVLSISVKVSLRSRWKMMFIMVKYSVWLSDCQNIGFLKMVRQFLNLVNFVFLCMMVLFISEYWNIVIMGKSIRKIRSSVVGEIQRYGVSFCSDLQFSLDFLVVFFGWVFVSVVFVLVMGFYFLIC